MDRPAGDVRIRGGPPVNTLLTPRTDAAPAKNGRMGTTNLKREKGGILRLLMMGVAVAAVVKELRLPREERSWHGQVGFVPYDFRPPTVDRVRSAWWSPGSDRLIGPAAFGVGWAVNLPRLTAMVKERIAS